MHRDYYQIQIDFMNNLYECLGNCKGGIFESPTGTGKSLSLICASLTFLTDYCGEKLQAAVTSLSETQKKFKRDYSGMTIHDLKKEISRVTEDPLEPGRNAKILYLCRTHLELDQIVSEIKRTKWNSSEKIRLIRLASRHQLCVNKSVLKHKVLINYKCKQLIDNVVPKPEPEEVDENPGEVIEYTIVNGVIVQSSDNNTKKKKKSEEVCDYYINRGLMKEYLLNNVCDIEDLVSAGKIIGCPYFATRASIKEADFVLAPYCSVLNKHTRNVLGIEVSECFVIIDESHNLVDAITDSYSASITKSELIGCKTMISAYYDAFLPIMSSEKRSMIRFTMMIVRRLLEHIRRYENSLPKVYDNDEFMNKINLQNITLLELWSILIEGSLADRIYDYCENDISIQPDFNALSLLADFILALSESEGKLLLSKDSDSTDIILKFLLLNPFNKFQHFLSESRCVILTGGTLTPSGEFFKLFGETPPNKFKYFSCGHVVPKENVLVTTIARGPSNREFRFIYANRDNLELLQELGEVIANLSCAVPNGMIVFVTSYAFLKKLKLIFAGEIIRKISERKKVFYDSKDESVLKEYMEAAERGGTMLFAVLRGALSEGINFSDGLGRCVVLVGMPYLNRHDLEVAVKMEYYDTKGQGYSGKEFYQNACHITVNQAIGRAIRHSKDFAAIVLIDSRHVLYKERRPAWMLKSFVDPGPHHHMIAMIRKFFRSKINTSLES